MLNWLKPRSGMTTQISAEDCANRSPTKRPAASISSRVARICVWIGLCRTWGRTSSSAGTDSIAPRNTKSSAPGTKTIGILAAALANSRSGCAFINPLRNSPPMSCGLRSRKQSIFPAATSSSRACAPMPLQWNPMTSMLSSFEQFAHCHCCRIRDAGHRHANGSLPRRLIPNRHIRHSRDGARGGRHHLARQSVHSHDVGDRMHDGDILGADIRPERCLSIGNRRQHDLRHADWKRLHSTGGNDRTLNAAHSQNSLKQSVRMPPCDYGRCPLRHGVYRRVLVVQRQNVRQCGSSSRRDLFTRDVGRKSWRALDPAVPQQRPIAALSDDIGGKGGLVALGIQCCKYGDRLAHPASCSCPATQSPQRSIAIFSSPCVSA